MKFKGVIWTGISLLVVFTKYSIQDLTLDALVSKGTPIPKNTDSTKKLVCQYKNEQHENDESFTLCPVDSSCVAVKVYQYYNKNWFHVHERKGCQSHLPSKLKTNCSESRVCSLDMLKDKGNKHHHYLYCCCNGNSCNTKLINDPYAANSNIVPVTNKKSEENSTMLLTAIISSVTFFLIVLCFSVVWIWRKIEKRQKPKRDIQSMLLSTQLSASSPKTMSEDSLDSILRGNLIHQGSNSAVRLGMMKGQPVAIKVFPPRSKMQWVNEKEIYEILDHHPNIANFITSEDALQSFGFGGLIVMTYYTEGSLLNYLRNFTLSWKHMIRLGYCITNGLAYLHSERNRNGTSKTSVAHRDLKSRNVLVKSDGTCVLADFGFALRLNGKFLNGSFPLVGSPRYMAPEVLDGSIVQSDWANAFKQVDCYGLGLLLWELMRRCNEILQPGNTTPDCLLPYEEELGPGPCVNKVLSYVCIKKKRPKFPEQWVQKNVPVDYMKQTIVECWDQDGDARLSPYCVLNRLRKMGNFKMTEKDIYKDFSFNDPDDDEIFCGEIEEHNINMAVVSRDDSNDDNYVTPTPNVCMVPSDKAGLLQKL